MKIQVLGPGCANCKNLYALTVKAVAEMGIKDKVEYITDIRKMLELGVMQSPVLAVNGQAVMTGYVPDIDRIKEAIKDGYAIDGSCDCCKDAKCCDDKQACCGGGCC